MLRWKKVTKCFGFTVGLAPPSPLLIGRTSLTPRFLSEGQWLNSNEAGELAGPCFYLLFYLFIVDLTQSEFHPAGPEEVKSSLLSVLIKPLLRLMIFSKDLIYP